MEFLTFDTETQKGKAFLACTSDGKSEKDFFINSKSDAIEFFVGLQANCKTGFCFNLEYDISALIKYFGQRAVIDFYVEKPIEFEHGGSTYQISGFIRKFVKIAKLTTKKVSPNPNQLEALKKENKKIRSQLNGTESKRMIDELLTLPDKDGKIEKTSHENTIFYDICQYYEYLSLDKVAQKYLGEKKSDIPDAWKRNMLKYFNASESNRNRIIKYCRKDTRLTHKITSHFIQMLIDAGVIAKDKIKTSRYYSSGYIAKKYINKKAKVMSFYDEKVNDFMKSFCFGGRIEVTRRGYFDKAYLYDINSAYGSGLANLKNITGHSFSQKPADGADYFFADCEFYLPENYIQPVPVKFKNWKYPFGNGRAILDKRTFENVQKSGQILKVHECLNVYAEDSFPFRKIINNLYSQRQKSEAHKFIFKNLINSYIGKLNEKVRIRTFIDEDQEEDMLEWLGKWRYKEKEFEELIKGSTCGCYEKEQIDSNCRNPICVEFRKKYNKLKQPPNLYKIGENMFYTEEKLKYKTHPIYNALVVSGMRNSIYEEGLKLGDNLIGFFTDAFFSKVPLKITSKKLGGFAEKYEGWLYLIGAGVHETEQGTRIRGYNSNISLVEYANKFKNRDIMETPSLERIGMGRAVGTMQSFNTFNELIESKKDMNINFDTNRMWDNQFKNYAESLKGNINSHPIKL